MADHIMVMKDGRMVEQGSPDEVMEHPREDYTRRLMAAAFVNTAESLARSGAEGAPTWSKWQYSS